MIPITGKYRGISAIINYAVLSVTPRDGYTYYTRVARYLIRNKNRLNNRGKARSFPLIFRARQMAR